MGTQEATPKRRWRPRFSLLTLVLGVLFVGACGGLWYRWEPWVVVFEMPASDSSFVTYAFSTSGTLCSIVDDDGHIEVLDWKRKVITAKWRAPNVRGGPHRISPDGRSIAVLQEQKEEGRESDAFTLGVWDTSSASLRMTAPDYAFIYFPVWAADGRNLFIRTFSEDNVDDRVEDGFDWWDTHTGRCLLSLRLGPTAANAHSAGGGNSGQGAQTEVVPATSAEVIRRCLNQPNGQRVVGVHAGVSEDGRFISTSICGSQQMQIWDFEKRCCRRVLEFPAPFIPEGETVFSPDGNRLATTVRRVKDGATSVQVWDVLGAHLLATLEGQQNLRSFGSAFSTDGSRLIAYADEGGGQNVWEATTGRLLNSHGHSPSQFVITAPDGYRAASCSRHSTSIVDAVTGQRLFQLPDGGPVLFAPDSQSFIAGTGGDGAGCYLLRRPEYWWGIAWLPEFWIALLSGGALLVIADRRLRARKAVKQEAA